MSPVEQALKALEFFKDWSNFLLVTTVAALGWASTERHVLASAKMKRFCIWSLALSTVFGIFTLGMIPLVAQQATGKQSIFQEGVTFYLLWVVWEVGPFTLKLVCWPQHVLFIVGVLAYAWGARKQPA